MGIFDGSLFDFNGDGKTDAFEFAMAMSIIEDIEQEEREQEKDSFDGRKEVFGAVCVRFHSLADDGSVDGFVRGQFSRFPRVEGVPCGVFRQHCSGAYSHGYCLVCSATVRGYIPVRVRDSCNRACGDTLFFTEQAQRAQTPERA